MKLIKLLQVTSVAFFFAGSAFAQTSGTVSNHAIPIGKGAGQTGFTSVTCADKLFLSGVSGLDPACRAIVGADLPFPAVSTLGGVKSLAAASNQFLTGLGTDGAFTRAQPAFSNLSGSATCAQLPALTGDITTSAGSCATAIGAAKVTNTMIAAMASAQWAAIISDETGTGPLVFATSPVFTTPNLGTPSAATLTNATGLPIAGISGLGTGVATFLATPSSANLAAAVTGETGSGALVFGTSPNITTPTGIVKGDVGLGNVDNTSDVMKWAATKTLTNTTYDTAGTGNVFKIGGTAVSAVTGTGAAVLAASPALTGAPTAPTATPSDNSTKIATTAYVDAQVAGGVAGVASVDTATGALTISGLLSRSSQDLRVTAATKANQQTGTSAVLAVTPSQQQSHDSAAKAWAVFTGATPPVVLSSYNVTSVTRVSLGVFQLNFTTAFASANYVCNVTGEAAGAIVIGLGQNTTRAAGSYQSVFANTGTAIDPSIGNVVCYGRQ